LAALLATGHAPLWVLYLDTTFAAIVLAFDSPTRQALLPALVPREDLLSATSLNAVVFTGATLVGPALGGLLLGPLGAAWLFAVNGLTTLAVLAALLTMRGVSGREGNSAQRAGLADGARYVWTRRPVLAILALSAAISVLGGGYQTLLPVLARDNWHVGASGYGLLASAPGLGALLGGFTLAALGDLRRKELIALGGPALMVLGLLTIARVPPFAVGLSLLALVGVCASAAGAVIATLLQFLAPGELRGRIMALNTVAVVGLSSFGGMLCGALAQAFGAPAAIAAAALGVALLLPLLARHVARA
jgi:MFS family permease